MCLRGLGTLHVDLEVMSPRQSANARGNALYIIGCRFVERSGIAERLLQRVIVQLECKH